MTTKSLISRLMNPGFVSASALLGICLVGCNSSSNNAPSPLSPMATATQELQNPSGCLDYGALNERIQKAKTSRTTVLDVKYGKEPSESLLYSSSEDLNDKESAIPSTIQQSGCKSVTITDVSGQEYKGEIIQHGRTSLRILAELPAPASAPAADNAVENNAESAAAASTPVSVDMTVELTSENRVRVRQTLPTTKLHVCNNKPVEETVQTTEMHEITFGDRLPGKSKPSSELESIRERIQDMGNVSPDKLEEQYCKTGQ